MHWLNIASTLVAGIHRVFLSSYPGRILNRFAKDIGLMDENLPPTIADFNQVRYLAT